MLLDINKGAFDILSIPPAIINPDASDLIIISPNIIAFKPEPHILFIVRHSTLFGRPEYRAACLAGAWPIPADRTFPIITSSTSFTPISIWSNKPEITLAPNWGDENSDSVPPYEPIGVLQAWTINVSLLIIITTYFT